MWQRVQSIAVGSLARACILSLLFDVRCILMPRGASPYITIQTYIYIYITGSCTVRERFCIVNLAVLHRGARFTLIVIRKTNKTTQHGLQADCVEPYNWMVLTSSCHCANVCADPNAYQWACYFMQACMRHACTRKHDCEICRSPHGEHMAESSCICSQKCEPLDAA